MMIHDLPLVTLDLPPSAAPLPDDVARLLVDQRARVEALREAERERGVDFDGFIPSDSELAYRLLRTLREREAAASFCEWGSGMGAVTVLAALLGFDACGIETHPGLVAMAESLAEAHDVPATFLTGSYVPDDYDRAPDVDHADVLFPLGDTEPVGPPIEDLEVIYVYPWPHEHELHLDLFARRAAVGATLILYRGSEEEPLVVRKTDGPIPEGPASEDA